MGYAEQRDDPAAMLVDMAEQLGVDRAHAHDVVGAVFSFCRERHGKLALGKDYVAFLVARSVLHARGEQLTPDALEEIAPPANSRERMLLRALAAAEDPSALYESSRMQLVHPASSGIAPGGRALMVNLSRVTVRPHENLSFLWLSVFKRIAGWVAAWRDGNPGLDVVLIRTGRQVILTPELRELFLETLRKASKNRGLPPGAPVWMD